MSTGTSTGTEDGGAVRTVDAVVVGGGVAGLVAARGLVARGLRVLVLEAAEQPGGPVRGGRLDVLPGVPLDLGAESFAARGTGVGALAAELGLDVVEPSGLPAWGYAAGRAFPLPKAGILGIPAHPWAADVRRAIGWPGALRASLDRVLPRRAVDVSDLGAFSRSRLGRRVTDRLVSPVAAGVHSATLDRLDVDAVAPGLREAFAREGSLARAVAAQRALAPAGSAVRGLDGGMHALVEALAAALGDVVVTGATVEEIRRDVDGTWTVGVVPTPRPGTTAGGPAGTAGAAGAAGADVPATVRAPRLVVTTPRVVDLLARHTGGVAEPLPDPEPGADVRLVTLVLDAPALDAAPRGSGMLVAQGARGTFGTLAAKGLTHSTAKWPWLADRVRAAAGPGVHVVRLSHGRLGAPTPEPTPEQAARDASVLLGTDLTGRVLAHHVQRWDGMLPPPTPAYRREVAAFVRRVDDVPGLAVTGGWIAGTGLAAVVPHAQAAAAGV